MKKPLFALLTISTVLLTGCWTVYQTEPTVVDTSTKYDMNLGIKGFEFLSMQATGGYTGYGTGSTYNFQTNSYSQSNGMVSGTTYEYRPDKDFSNDTVDIFEELGFNIQSDKPDLILVGRIGNGWYDFKSPLMYCRDIPVFLVGMCTAAATLSCNRENYAEIIVYGVDGKRIGSYFSRKNHYAFTVALPFANFANPDAWESHGDISAARYAMADCLNKFLADLDSGKYVAAITNAENHYATPAQPPQPVPQQ